ncbi:MAG: hypothetical protein KIT78_00170 [Steroidobacteraceae bacterium]|nr:hypothetical protein [Steroidobacteraceae bacterium]
MDDPLVAGGRYVRRAFSAGSAWHASLRRPHRQWRSRLGDTSWRLHPRHSCAGTLALSILTQQGADRIAAELELKPTGDALRAM